MYNGFLKAFAYIIKQTKRSK